MEAGADGGTEVEQEMENSEERVMARMGFVREEDGEKGAKHRDAEGAEKK